MQQLLKPIRTESLKDTFVKRFEELILSGAFPIGQKLPSERELALRLNVSRPVVHGGLVDLAAKGLVTLIPRVGTIVNDYRREGSLSLLTSLVNYHQGDLEPELFTSLLEMRFLFEVETARLAAIHRTQDQLESLGRLLQEEENVNYHDDARISELDFDFHHLVALSSGNHIYPLLLNSFKQCYLNLAGQFFSDQSVVPEVFAFHQEMVCALEENNEKKAAQIMKSMLAHGAEHLKKSLKPLPLTDATKYGG
jgi:GntR family transcriptional regulator, transcriptional repressor for pyruvate dehydrogenase complex